MKPIDSHAHYNSFSFNEDRDNLLKLLQDKCEYILNVGTNFKSFNQIISLSKKYPFLYNVLGFFPCDVQELTDKNIVDSFFDYLSEDKVVGIGEIGLDYHWKTVDPEIQKKYFVEQINLAKEINLPIVIHSRDAEKDTLDIMLANSKNLRGEIHCYSYGLESAKKYLDMGFYFGVGGTSTYKGNNELRDVIRYLPIENILLETDSPYLSPVPNRGKRNDSSNLIYVAKNISDIKDIPVEEVIAQTNINTKKLFKLK